MIAYTGEVYAQPYQPYDGDAWNWNGQQWGTGYEQMQSWGADLASWEYHQPQQHNLSHQQAMHPHSMQQHAVAPQVMPQPQGLGQQHTLTQPHLLTQQQAQQMLSQGQHNHLMGQRQAVQPNQFQLQQQQQAHESLQTHPQVQELPCQSQLQCQDQTQGQSQGLEQDLGQVQNSPQTQPQVQGHIFTQSQATVQLQSLPQHQPQAQPHTQPRSQFQQPQPPQQQQATQAAQSSPSAISQPVASIMHSPQQVPQVQQPVGQSSASAQQAAPASNWGCQAQEGASVPKPGAELLTELRLAELKRLIDRDAQALRRTSANTDAVLSSSAVPSAARHGLRADAPDFSLDRQSVQSRENIEGSAEAGGGSLAVGAPGLEAPPVERLVKSLATWEPESREYGEMGIHAGEDILVRGDVQNDWIWGSRRGDNPDEGWIPASGFGLVDYYSSGEEDTSAAAALKETPPSRRQRNRHRDPKDQAPLANGKNMARKGNESSASGMQKGKGSVDVTDEKQRKGARPAEAAAEETWHQHGNWWSKQRHLKVQESKEPDPSWRKDDPSTWKQEDEWPTKKADDKSAWKEIEQWTEKPTRRKAQPPQSQLNCNSADENEEWQGNGRRSSKAKGRGRAGNAVAPVRGAGRGGRTGGPRERASLSSLLDRLQKPLVPPKPNVAN